MRYDVFLVSALEDSAMAETLVRRLKALKFKVRYDKKRTHTTSTPKDIKDANDSQSVIVLWSKAACDTTDADSDWVHAMAHQARSRKNVLVQIGLDETIPDEPFDADKRYMIEGLTARTLVDGYEELVEDLGARDGRKDLRDWLALKASDAEGKAAWKTSHPTDPLALADRPKPKPAPKKPAAKPKVAAAATATAAVAATSFWDGPLPKEYDTVELIDGVDFDDADLMADADMGTLTGFAGLAASDRTARLKKVDLYAKAQSGKWVDKAKAIEAGGTVRETATLSWLDRLRSKRRELGVASAAAATGLVGSVASFDADAGLESEAPKAAAVTYDEGPDGSSTGFWMIAAILAGIAALLLFAWINGVMRGGSPAVGGAAPASVLAKQCPAGQMPAYLLDETLRTAPINND